MTTALIGYTGFVGYNIMCHSNTHMDLYNRTNIRDIYNKKYDLVICAAPKGSMYIANKFPDDDLGDIYSLIKHLNLIDTKKLILISTTEVYANKNFINEDDKTDTQLNSYGKNRNFLENTLLVRDDIHIIRLPILVGDKLKKNFIYDLINGGSSEFVHMNSVFQFYDLANIWTDINKVIDMNLDVINFVSEPIPANDIARDIFDVILHNITSERRTSNILSKYSHHWDSVPKYLYTKEQIYTSIKHYKGLR